MFQSLVFDCLSMENQGLQSENMAEMWGTFCNASDTSANLSLSCINHALAIGLDVLLVLSFLLLVLLRTSSKYTTLVRGGIFAVSPLQLISAVFNCLLGLLYISSGIWIVIRQYRKSHSLLPLHWWTVLFFHGVTWLLLSVTLSLRRGTLPQVPLRVLSILAFFFSGIVCGFSSFDSVIQKKASYTIGLDIMSLLGSCLLVLCSYRANKNRVDEKSDLYAPLNGVDKENESEKTGSVCNVTPFSRAGFFSKMSFWWLNGLMKKGEMETLDDKDIPMLREEDRAGSCYSMFTEMFNKLKEVGSGRPPSVLKTIVICHWKEILVSGFFALLKIITLSAGPLLLNAFIRIAEGKESFKHEGFVLAVLLFCSKTVESFSQRQWYFRSRLIGLKVRSLLSAAIYKKQIKLSNSAKLMHSSGEIMNYVTVDAYRIGEFPFWFHQTWTTSLQLCFALGILFRAVGLATIASMVVIVFTVVCNTPLAKLQHKFQTKLMVAQDERLKAISEALINMKVLKLYAWENHFKNVIRDLREIELKWLSAVQLRKAYNSFLFWSSPVLVSAATFGACYFLGVPLYASNVFTFVATLRLVQDPVRSIPDVIGVVIQAKVSFKRIVNFLEAPELEIASVRQMIHTKNPYHSINIKSACLSWEGNLKKLSLSNLNLEVRPGEKVAICGEVGSGKSTLLASILGEVPIIHGYVHTFGSIAYVSQSAWIQTGSIRDNILFGLPMDRQRYHETLERCSFIKDLELLPYGDLTEIGERGANLSGGQKQRIQLARALYQNADVYLLDDPFSAVDAETAGNLFTEYVIEALFGKTVLLVTHQVDFLPAFDYVLLMSDGEILDSGPCHELLVSSKEFQSLVDAHKETAGSERLSHVNESSPQEIRKTHGDKKPNASSSTSVGDQLIKQEQREIGDTGFTPYIQYLGQNNGFLFFVLAVVSHAIFVSGQIMQNTWMAKNVDDPNVSNLKLILVYLLIGFTSTFFLLSRSLNTVVLGLASSKSLFNQLLDSLFRAPMSFHDSTPLGRTLSRVSADLSIVDLDVPFNLVFAVGKTTNFYSNLGVLAFITWPVLLVALPLLALAIRLQRYYFATAKALMRINGTSKSFVANHVAESLAGAMTIRAFQEEERFFNKYLELVDSNATPFFHNFAANEWLIGRLELLGSTLLSSSALFMVLLPPGTFASGFIGMALSYGLSLNNSLVLSIQNQCTLANYIISVERLNQYMHIPSEAPQVIESNRPPDSWPTIGKVKIQDLQIKYKVDGPLVLHGISCTFEGGHKIGIVGRTGSGKTTLIGALFRLVEPAGGRIIVDGIDTSPIGLHDLRSRFGIIPQDPTLFTGTVRYNLDPLGQHTDSEIWEVLKKCQLKEVVEEKEDGLDSLVMEEGSNWSMGQRQLFCLGRALVKRSKILVLDEATASIDNATDMILQKTIRTEFADCTVITVAHRIPTVMNCTKVLAISDGKLVEYDEPVKLMKTDGSLFRQLVKEYWSHNPQTQLESKTESKSILD